jgi:hypothetical protein
MIQLIVGMAELNHGDYRADITLNMMLEIPITTNHRREHQAIL